MKKLFFCLFALGLAMNLYAQSNDDPVIFEINGKNIRKSEFMREFLRSIGKDPKAAPTACTYEKRQALEEYVELFVNYRTKLEDAYVNGYDTMPSMLRELEGYRKELAAPYLIDSSTLEKIMLEAYERNHYVLTAAHIYVPLGFNPQPSDTLKAYNKSLEYYNRVIGGEDFFDVAREQAINIANAQGLEKDDPRRNDDGRLGNFTVFDMVYPFESAAYGLKVGEISKPIRTNYGYHVIKLLNKVPYFGKCTFQHIWIAEKTGKPDAAERLAKEAYKLITNGDNAFETVCRNYSDDHSTSENGGLMVDMAIRQIPPEYVASLATMKRGEITEPFQSRYGWHIVKLVDRDSLAAFEDMQPYYRQRMSRDERSNKPRESFIEQSKVRYGFKDYTTMYESVANGKKASQRIAMASLDECRAAINDSVFIKAWRYRDGMVTDMRPLFCIGESTYTAVDLLKFIESNQKAEGKKDYDMYLHGRYNNFIHEMVYDYAYKHLEASNTEFGELMKEYRNGLMIFAYNDANVWSKAVKDSAGLAKYYLDNVDKHSIDRESDAQYFIGESVDMKEYTFSDSSWMKPQKALKIVEKGYKSGLTDGAILTKLEKSLKVDSVNVMFKNNVIEVERQNILTKSQLHKGVYAVPFERGYKIVYVVGMLNPRPKTLVEARGFYINDYQNYLEQQLNKDLRKKYNVVIHQDVIDEIVY